jgi:hypothetical protein
MSQQPDPKLPRIALQVAIAPQVRFADATGDMITLADATNVAVIGSFSGMPLTAFPGDTVEQVNARFQQIVAAARGPRLVTPSGKPV